MNNKNFNKLFYQYNNLFIIVSFFLFSIIGTFLLVHSHFLGGGSDTYFHWQRIIELKKSFSYHNFFPGISLNEFGGNGSAVMSFYPYLNILPIVFLSYIIKSNINLIYFSFSFYTFIALLISYYSSLHINRRIDTSYLFSIMYSLSTLMIFHAFQLMDLGIVNTMVFLPLIIFGFINFIKNNKWVELSIGLTLIIFTHVLNSIFIIIFIFIWICINANKISCVKVLSLVKCIVLTLLTTSVFYVPFLKLLLLNNIHNPFYFQLSGVPFPDLINSAFNNSINYTLTIFAILGATIIPSFFYRKFSNIVKQMYWLSIIIIILISSIFPWSLFQNSFIKIIQFSWRLYFIPQLLLIYIFALGITKYLSKKISKKYIIFGIICFTLLLQISAQNQIIDKYKNNTDLNYKVQNDQSLPDVGHYKMSNSEQVNNLSYGFSSADYYPEESTVWFDKLRNSEGIYNINNTIKFNPLGNGILSFYNHNKNIDELNVPFVFYKGIKYKAYLDNQSIPFKVNKTNLFTLNNVKYGNHHVQIKVIPGISDVIIRILFFIGISIYIWLFFWNLYGKNKINIISLYKKYNSFG